MKKIKIKIIIYIYTHIVLQQCIDVQHMKNVVSVCMQWSLDEEEEIIKLIIHSFIFAFKYNLYTYIFDFRSDQSYSTYYLQIVKEKFLFLYNFIIY